MRDGPIRLSFRIKAFRPETIPMARLAEYMSDIAAMIGEQASVHFVELQESSVQLIHDVDYEAFPKVEARARAIQHGTAPAEPTEAYRRLNKKLAEDNTSGTYFSADGGGEILDFPGILAPKPLVIPPIEQPTTIDGQIVGVGGGRHMGTASVRILVDTGDRIQECASSRAMGKELRNFFLEEARRFNGSGRWIRGDDGRWALKAFVITSHEALDHRPLRAIVDELRAIPSELTDSADPWGDIIAERRGDREP